MFGNRLKQLRECHELTQQQLANLMHVGRPTIAGYEARGKEPDFEKIAWLSEYFNVSIDYLLGNTDIKEKPTPGNGDELTVEQQELLDLLKDLPDADFAKVQEYVQLLKLKRNP